MTDRKMVVKVLSSDYSSVVGTIPQYSTASTTWMHMGVGTAVVIGREEGPILNALLCHQQVVPMTFKAPGYPRWTGYVVNTQSESDFIKRDGQIVSSGSLTATLVSERKWLDRILAAPVPGSPWSNQTAAEFDTRTGPVDTVLRQYLTANIARVNGALPGADLPVAVTPAPVGDASPVVSISARNGTLRDELTETLRATNRDIVPELWLPGDPQPTGLSLTVPTIVFDVRVGRTQNFVHFRAETGGLKHRRVVSSIPGATAVVIGGPGEGTERVFDYLLAEDGRVESMGPQGYSEVFLDVNDVNEVARGRQGREKLAELSGKVAIEVDIDDRRPWVAGPTRDYWLGDTVRGSFLGVSITDKINRFTLTSNEEGFTSSVQFGANREVESADVQLARKVAQLQGNLQSTQARR